MYETFFKPLLDYSLALFLVLLFLPIYVVLGLLIYLKMGSPTFFRQERPGKDEKLFRIYKFRTMSSEVDEKGNLLPDEKRLHGLGKFIRSTSLDELPQLFNVLRGEMSFIGPRPLLVDYLGLYSDEQKKRHQVKPGITGLAQVNGRNAISFSEKFKYDAEYVEKISFMLDMKILFLTVKKVLIKEGVSSATHVTMEKFNGTN